MLLYLFPLVYSYSPPEILHTYSPKQTLCFYPTWTRSRCLSETLLKNSFKCFLVRFGLDRIGLVRFGVQALLVPTTSKLGPWLFFVFGFVFVGFAKWFCAFNGTLIMVWCCRCCFFWLWVWLWVFVLVASLRFWFYDHWCCASF